MKPQYLEASSSLRSLRRRWSILAVVSVLTLMMGYALLQSQWQAAFATRWLLLAALGFIFLLRILWISLQENYREGENRLLPSLGAGNYLTILRGALIAALLGFLLAPRPEGWVAWIPGICYTLAAIIDLFDGYVARLTRHTTRLGEILDLELDGLGMLAAALLATRYGQVPTWYVLVGGARYLFVAGLWLRKRMGKPVYELPESASRRPFAGAQMGFLAVALLPVFSPPGTYVAGILFAIPFLTGFARDWLLVCGALKPGLANSQKYATSVAGARRHLLQQWIPLALRAAAVSLTGVVLVSKLQIYVASFQGSVTAGLSLILFVQMIGLALIALGAAGRTATLAILFSVGIQQRLAVLTSIDVALMVIATALFFLGTGPFSLWKPEDKIIRRRLGEV